MDTGALFLFDFIDNDTEGIGHGRRNSERENVLGKEGDSERATAITNVDYSRE